MSDRVSTASETPALETAFVNLDNSLGRLDDLLEQLGARLRPALGPDLSDGNPDRAVDVPERSPIVDRVYGHHERVESLSDRVFRLLDRLEL